MKRASAVVWIVAMAISAKVAMRNFAAQGNPQPAGTKHGVVLKS